MRSIFFAAAAAAVVIFATMTAFVNGNTVWPMPKSIQSSDTLVTFSLDFTFTSNYISNTYLAATRRYLNIINRELVANGDIVKCSVSIHSANESLTLETDESYNLTITSSSASINAATVYGAMHAMETLSQLVSVSGTNATVVSDSPRFQFRATMIDTSRHFYPVTAIKMHIDAMAYSKMNVLHWHLVDDVSFPYESVTFPSLSETGAYAPTHVYTPNDVQDVISYALSRGIRVIPEFDTPGHVFAGYLSIPNLLTPCYTQGAPDGTYGPLNPTLNSTYEFLAKFYAEVKDVFPDNFVHVGGDEVSFNCWESNPQILAWMEDHPEISTYAQLEQYYELKLLNILEAQGSSYICWQEIFDNGVKILPNTVIDVWKSSGWNDTMARAVEAGYHTVLSAPFYLNYISYGQDWKNYYSVEPTDFDAPQTLKDKYVGGVEACMWSEYVDATNFIPRFWPRAAAVAERAWSPMSVNDADAATTRLHEFRCKLIQRGINAEPITDGGNSIYTGIPAFCEHEYQPVYQPPF
eukprot:m.103075 g.103075  ORF g.103075 m.103075 type:complete len:523 (-) comp9088_c10_seq1:339-1907(-)